MKTSFIKRLLVGITLILGNAFATPQIIYLQKGDQHIALFGTVHIAKPDFYPLPQTVLNELSASDALAVEIDLTDNNIKNQTMQLMMASAFTKDTQPLTEKQLDQINKVLWGTVDESLGGEPWFLSVMISLERADRLGFTDIGIDETLITLAKQQGKKVISLEEPSEQITIFTKIPRSESLQLFEDAISDSFETELAMTESIWQNNDTQIANTMHKKMQTETPVLYQLINIERNHTLAKRIAEQSAKHPQLFIAIGSMHLYGKDSVVENLIKEGFKPAH